MFGHTLFHMFQHFVYRTLSSSHDKLASTVDRNCFTESDRQKRISVQSVDDSPNFNEVGCIVKGVSSTGDSLGDIGLVSNPMPTRPLLFKTDMNNHVIDVLMKQNTPNHIVEGFFIWSQREGLNFRPAHYE